MRTTLDIEPAILEELKKRQRESRLSLGKLASGLLAEALHREAGKGTDPEDRVTLRPLYSRSR